MLRPASLTIHGPDRRHLLMPLQPSRMHKHGGEGGASRQTTHHRPPATSAHPLPRPHRNPRSAPHRGPHATSPDSDARPASDTRPFPGADSLSCGLSRPGTLPPADKHLKCNHAAASSSSGTPSHLTTRAITPPAGGHPTIPHRSPAAAGSHSRGCRHASSVSSLPSAFATACLPTQGTHRSPSYPPSPTSHPHSTRRSIRSASSSTAPRSSSPRRGGANNPSPIPLSIRSFKPRSRTGRRRYNPPRSPTHPRHQAGALAGKFPLRFGCGVLTRTTQPMAAAAVEVPPPITMA